MVEETKTRSVVKTIVWRIVAILNSYTILTCSITSSALKNALLMNLTGFFVYYFFERICNKIPHGKIIQDKK
ncbi:MAG TPA: hypothetical protein DCX27_12005 [Balneola sp.]|nr:hypothetical protein [Balneola sp.]